MQTIPHARAHWLTRQLIAIDNLSLADLHVALRYDPSGAIVLEAGSLAGGQALPLRHDPAGLPPALVERFPHLSGFAALYLPPTPPEQLATILRCQLVLAGMDEDGALDFATGVQLGGVLDDLFATEAPLGVTYTGDAPRLNVWAPTAQEVALRLYDVPHGGEAYRLAMDCDERGVWTIQGEPDWTGRYYEYEVAVYVPATGRVEHNLVTDPYSLSLAMGSLRSQIVGLEHAATQPAAWGGHVAPPLAAVEDIVLYELHVRDFSATDRSVPELLRGTYGAFALESDGTRHLRRMAGAGVTHVHLLPCFDIASVPEDRGSWHGLDDAALAKLPPDDESQAMAVEVIAERDGFNWGYDPWHYTVPDGSYAFESDGAPRLREFRTMVLALHRLGLRVVMDVVYNHTAAAGQNMVAVLDRIVPGYYHRLNLDGGIEMSTCCNNTASERAMFERLMLDSILTWVRQYRVDGFRFDLMGHHMKSTMLRLRAALDALTPERDGVDGSMVYLYGEGWDFGEVAGNARGVNAAQRNLANTRIGTFNDRVRDAVRGGRPFDGGEARKNQGFASGLLTDPNGWEQGDEDGQRDQLLFYQDLLKVSLAGNLAGYRFADQRGATIVGGALHYNGSPAAYAGEPGETVNYIEAHDNETLFDKLQYALPQTTPMDERVKAHVLSCALILLGQGIPFLQAGQEIMRSKSLDRNSYNSGDWFNRLDWTYATNGWGIGLPPGENRHDWDVMRPLLADPSLRPERRHIEAALAGVETLLRVRSASPLFRLRTLAQVQARVSFGASVPGLIAMQIEDGAGAEDLDQTCDRMLVVFNAHPTPQTYADEALRGVAFAPHPLLASAGSYDAERGVFTVAGRTAAVFVAS